MVIKGYLFSILYCMLCLVFAALLHKFGVAKQITRKIVHILVGVEWVILYHFLGPTLHFLAVCILFLIVLVIAYKKSLMPMIASDGDNAPGTVYYAVAMSIMAAISVFVPQMILPFGIGVFCTSLGDGFAGLIGQSIPFKFNPRVYGEKSLFGAIVNFGVSFCVAIAFSSWFEMGIGILGCLVIAVLSLELELFTARGLDNITITLGTSFLSFAICNYEAVWNYIVPILLTPLLVAFVHKKNALSLLGVIGAVLLGAVVSISLGNGGFLVLLSFLIGGLIADKIKKRRYILEQSECRGFVQVLSNGGVGAAFAFAFLLTKNQVFAVGFCASLAEALADTSASGIGAFSKNTFDLFRMKKCESGLSGGMSFLGTFVSLFASAIIALISFALGVINIRSIVFVSLAGFLGGIFDSFLGSLFQIKYRCVSCGKITEDEVHCGAETIRFRGFKFVNNNVVNFASTLFSAVVAVLLQKL